MSNTRMTATTYELPEGVKHNGQMMGLECFTDIKETGSTFALKADEVTTEKILAKLEETRKRFRK